MTVQKMTAFLLAVSLHHLQIAVGSCTSRFGRGNHTPATFARVRLPSQLSVPVRAQYVLTLISWQYQTRGAHAVVVCLFVEGRIYSLSLRASYDRGPTPSRRARRGRLILGSLFVFGSVRVQEPWVRKGGLFDVILGGICDYSQFFAGL
jgi:hypothetical protein